MPQRETKDYLTVKVMGSQGLARPDGRAAIMLNTDRFGPIAFEVNQLAIDTLRKSLVVAEQLLRQPKLKN